MFALQIHTSMRDANDVGQILKDMPGVDPTKSTITLTHQPIPRLVAELVIMATRMGENYTALSCLENIFDNDIRVECTNKVYELAQHLWMDGLVTELIDRGYIKGKQNAMRSGTPSSPTRRQILPGTAADALVTHAERKQQLFLEMQSGLDVAPEVVVNMTVSNEEDVSSEEEPDVLAEDEEAAKENDGEEHTTAFQGTGAKQSDSGDAEVEDEEAGRKRSKGKKKDIRNAYWLADEKSLKLLKPVQELLASNTPEGTIEIIASKYGHTLSLDFVQDVHESMELEALTAGVPKDVINLNIIDVPVFFKAVL